MQKNSIHTNIKVFCRFRPFNQKQLQAHALPLHRIANNQTQLIIKQSNDQKSQKQKQKSDQISFMFDLIFDTNSTQQEVYEKVGLPVLQNILDGFNGTIMAYGQTSSGKTHTMQGYDINDKQIKGIIPRIIERLFMAIQRSTEAIQYKLKISIFELYMQKIRDLLDVSKKDLKIRQNKTGPYIQNLTEVYVGDKTQIFKLIHLGQKNRITCSTNMNDQSSRSHMIFQLSLNQFNNQDSTSKTSKLYLIDLAGSQKISKTGAQGKVLEQAKKINLSLTNLGKVIKNLAQKNNFIPYRDSKLTRILTDSLGGNSKTTLIVTCSPHEMHLPQTISTLRFGQNAQKIKNKPKINKQLTVQQLQKIVQKLQEQIQAKNIKIDFIQKYIKEMLKAELPNYKELKMYANMKLKQEDQQENNNKNNIINQEKRKNQQLKLLKQIKQIAVKLSDEEDSQILGQQNVKEEQIQNKLEQSIQQDSLNKTKYNNNVNEQNNSKKLIQQIQAHQQSQKYYLTRISQMQVQLSNFHIKIDKQVQRYCQLKKQYNQLHSNLSSIIKQNIDLQEQKNNLSNIKSQLQHKLTTLQYKHSNTIALLQKSNQTSQKMQQNLIKQHQSQLQNKLIQNNSILIKMILGQIFTIIGPNKQQQIKKVIENDYWYKKIVIDQVNCTDFYIKEKEKINQHIKSLMKQKKQFQKQVQRHLNDNKSKQLTNMNMNNFMLIQQSRIQRQKTNQRIIFLQKKLDKLFDEYHQMINLQNTWKVQCQLYERKLKKKQEKILQLEEMIHQLTEQIDYLTNKNIEYDDYSDTKSVKSKIVKPLRGGFFFK